MTGAAASPVRYERGTVEAYWSALGRVLDVAQGMRRLSTGLGGRDGGGLVAIATRLQLSVDEVRRESVTAGVPPRDAHSRVDVGSERWVTAVHEAGHAVAASALGHRSVYAGVLTEDSGLAQAASGPDKRACDAKGSACDRAVISMAGDQAARFLTGRGGGAEQDYRNAEQGLRGTGYTIAWAEDTADRLVRVHRRDIERIGRLIYATGRENGARVRRATPERFRARTC